MRLKDKKSPLKSKPLRHAGQSLDEEIEKIGTLGSGHKSQIKPKF